MALDFLVILGSEVLSLTADFTGCEADAVSGQCLEKPIYSKKVLFLNIFFFMSFKR